MQPYVDFIEIIRKNLYFIMNKFMYEPSEQAYL